jgi:hypothetical protein
LRQGMRGDRFAHTRLFKCIPACDLDGARRDRLLGPVAWKQPLLWTGLLPVDPQKLQQRWREHHVPVFSAFARLDPNNHPLAVDRGWFQANRL